MTTFCLATFPPSLQILAGLLATAPFSWLMGRYGRKTGFVLGGGFAVAGGVVGAIALYEANFWLLCAGHMFLGAALACYQYFRFAAAETVSERWQPVAISLMLTSGLIAAFAGPQLFIVAKDMFTAAPLAGAYAAISVLSITGLCPLALIQIDTPFTQTRKERLNLTSALMILCRKPILSAVMVGSVSQAVMVLLMTPTPLAMVSHGFSEAVAGDVIRWHVVAMFAPSFFTGFLIQKLGNKAVVQFGLVLLIASAAIAASGLAPHHFYGSLVLLAFAAGATVATYGWAFLSIMAVPILLLTAAVHWFQLKNSGHALEIQ